MATPRPPQPGAHDVSIESIPRGVFRAFMFGCGRCSDIVQPERAGRIGAGGCSLLRGCAEGRKLPKRDFGRCHELRSIMRDTVLLLAMNGLIWGLIIALIALGLSVIFG